MAFCIITDSASDVPQWVKEEFQLHVIPTPVTIGEKDYFDGETIFPSEFYKIQQENKLDIKTYHISQYMFEQHFTPYAERGDELLYICFSTGIAGTFQAANLAAQDVKEKYPDFQITIIDSKCASIGFGLVVYKLLRMQRNGAPKELICEAAEFFCANMEHTVTVGTLEYLRRGGRVTTLSAVFGGALDIKPILHVDEAGALVAAEKVRGMRKALHRCIEIVGEKGAALDRQTIGIVYGSDDEVCNQVIDQLKEKYHVKDVLKSQIGCAIGAHTGPEIIGIVYERAIDEKFEKYL